MLIQANRSMRAMREDRVTSNPRLKAWADQGNDREGDEERDEGDEIIDLDSDPSRHIARDASLHHPPLEDHCST